MSLKPLCLFLAIAATTFSAVAGAPLVPLESFVYDATFSDPQLSPDGKHLAVNVRIKRDGRMIPTMTIYSLPDLQIVSTIALGKFEIPAAFSWVTNTRLVVQKGIEVGLRERPQMTGEVVAVNIDGSKQEYLYGYDNFKNSSRGTRYNDDYGFGGIVNVPSDRNGHVIIGSYLWREKVSTLYDINSTNSVRTRLAQLPVSDLTFVLQNNGKPRFAFGDNEDVQPVLYRRDDATDEWKDIKDKPLGRQYYPVAFAPGDKEFFVLQSGNGGPNKFYRESMATGERQLIAENSYGDIDVRYYTPYPEVPFAVGTNLGRPKVQYVDPEMAEAKLHKELSSQFPDATVSFVNYTDDGSRLLFWVGSDRDPGSYYLYDKKTGKADLLLANMQDIDPDQMAERRPIHFTARDGLEIHGYLTLPANPAKKKLPMVVLPHGGPYGIHDSWYFDRDAQFLASRGYAVLQVNFRGSGGRGINFVEAGYRQWGGKMMDDIIDGVKWAATQPDVDGKRVCTYGISFGGYAALMLPVREPTMFKCAVGYAGVYDMAYMYEEKRAKVSTYVENYFKKTLGTDAQELTRFSPAMQADKIKIPVLLVHGEHDKVVNVEHGDRMNAALIKSGNQPEYMRVPKEGHGFYDPLNQAAFLRKLEAFLDKNIGN